MAGRIPGLLNRLAPFLANASQILVLGIVWMAMAQAKAVILGSGGEVLSILVLSFCYHLVLVAAAVAGCRFFGIRPGRRERVKNSNHRLALKAERTPFRPAKKQVGGK